MAYIFCDACQVGFHSNVYTCPECGKAISRGFTGNGGARRHRPHPQELREEAEDEVREAIYGWRSGSVAVRGEAVHGGDPTVTSRA